MKVTSSLLLGVPLILACGARSELHPGARGDAGGGGPAGPASDEPVCEPLGVRSTWEDGLDYESSPQLAFTSDGDTVTLLYVRDTFDSNALVQTTFGHVPWLGGEPLPPPSPLVLSFLGPDPRGGVLARGPDEGIGLLHTLGTSDGSTGAMYLHDAPTDAETPDLGTFSLAGARPMFLSGLDFVTQESGARLGGLGFPSSSPGLERAHLVVGQGPATIVEAPLLGCATRAMAADAAIVPDGFLVATSSGVTFPSGECTTADSPNRIQLLAVDGSIVDDPEGAAVNLVFEEVEEDSVVALRIVRESATWILWQLEGGALRALRVDDDGTPVGSPATLPLSVPLARGWDAEPRGSGFVIVRSLENGVGVDAFDPSSDGVVQLSNEVHPVAETLGTKVAALVEANHLLVTFSSVEPFGTTSTAGVASFECPSW